MQLEQARYLAETCLVTLRMYCSRVEIAGSIRRGKAEVKDIEIVCIPNVPDMRDMFYSGPCFQDAVLDISEPDRNVIKNGERYKQIKLHAGINLDLFIVRPPAQWGVIFTIRTGPSDFSNWLVTQRNKRGALPSNCHVEDGQVIQGGDVVQMPEEIDFLKFCGLGWIEPSQREAQWGRMPK